MTPLDDMTDLPALARILWQMGFSEDSFRNWRMAELLLASPRFHELRRQGPVMVDTPDDEDEVDAYNKPMAYLLYDLSYALEHPSHDAFTNWIVALRLWQIPH